MFTLVDDPEVWEAQTVFGKDGPFAQNIRDCWNELRSQDRAIAPMVVFANEIEVGILWKPGAVPEQEVFAMVPVNHPNITHVTRRSNALDGASEYDWPLSSQGDELGSMAYFDDVLIPWDRVRPLGNLDHAMPYPQRIFDWIHIETQTRHVINAELIAGLAVLVTESLGTNAAPIVQSQVADLVRFRETCRAFTLAAEETGIFTPGGLYKPNNIFVDFGRAYYLENVPHMVDQLIDLCGRGVVIHPTDRDDGALRASDARLGSMIQRRNVSRP